MLKISVNVIPHSDQRYPTVGDWRWHGDELDVYVSDLGDWRYEASVALHEVYEALACRHRGISAESVDTFDKQFEVDRIDGKHPVDSEPGFDPAAPYYREHVEATMIERQVAGGLDICWEEYELVIEEMP